MKVYIHPRAEASEMSTERCAAHSFWSALVFLTAPLCVSVLHDWGEWRELSALSCALVALLVTSLYNHARPYRCRTQGWINYVDRAAVWVAAALVFWRAHPGFAAATDDVPRDVALVALAVVIGLLFCAIRLRAARRIASGDLYVRQSTVWLHVCMHGLAGAAFLLVVLRT